MGMSCWSLQLLALYWDTWSQESDCLLQASWATYSGSSLPTQYSHVLFMLLAKESRDASAWWREVARAQNSVYLAPSLIVAQRDSDEWFMSLGDLDRLCTLLWPMEVVGNDMRPVFTPSSSAAEPFDCVFVSDLATWRAQPVVWASPMKKLAPAASCTATSAASSSSSSSASLLPAPSAMMSVFAGGILAERKGDPTSIQVALAYRGFKGVNQADVLSLLQREKEVAAGLSEFEIIWEAVCHWLSGQPETVMLEAMAQRRLKTLDLCKQGFFHEAGVAECFDSSDWVEVEKTTEATAKGVKEFRHEFRHKVKEYHKSKKIGKKKKKEKVIKGEPANLTKDEAQKWMPPAHTWAWRCYKDLTNNRWAAYHALHGTVSRSWPARGELAALRLLLAEVWRQSIALGEAETCPYEWVTTCTDDIEADD